MSIKAKTSMNALINNGSDIIKKPANSMGFILLNPETGKTVS